MKDLKLDYLGKGPDFEYYIDIKTMQVYESIYGTLMPLMGPKHEVLAGMSGRLSKDNSGKLEQIIESIIVKEDENNNSR